MTAYPLLIYAVSPLHVGTGRSSGVVDLPVQRDPFNYPVVYASSFKGALKSHCFIAQGSIGIEMCGKAPICCCLFGSEKGDDTGSGLITVTDLIPLFIPMPSNTHGYIYATSKYLLSRALDLLDLTSENDLKRMVTNLLKPSEAQSTQAAAQQMKVDVAGIEKALVKLQNGDALVKLGKLTEAKISNGVVIFDDNEGSEMLERAYIRMTRNKIDLRTKTVAERALWTEEYLPQGTVMLGLIIPSIPKENKYCGEVIGEKVGQGGSSICDAACYNKVLDKFREQFLGGSAGNNYGFINLGGKETIGKGIIKIKIIMQDSIATNKGSIGSLSKA